MHLAINNLEVEWHAFFFGTPDQRLRDLLVSFRLGFETQRVDEVGKRVFTTASNRLYQVADAFLVLGWVGPIDAQQFVAAIEVHNSFAYQEFRNLVLNVQTVVDQLEVLVADKFCMLPTRIFLSAGHDGVYGTCRDSEGKPTK